MLASKQLENGDFVSWHQDKRGGKKNLATKKQSCKMPHLQHLHSLISGLGP
jgi:hypothetical protein